MIIKPKSQNIQVMLNWFNYFNDVASYPMPHNGGEWLFYQNFRLN